MALSLFVTQKACCSSSGCNWTTVMLSLAVASLSKTQMPPKHVVVANHLQQRCDRYITSVLHLKNQITQNRVDGICFVVRHITCNKHANLISKLNPTLSRFLDNSSAVHLRPHLLDIDPHFFRCINVGEQCIRPTIRWIDRNGHFCCISA